MVSGAFGRPFFCPSKMNAKRESGSPWHPRINGLYIVRGSAALIVRERLKHEKHGLQGTITNPSGRSTRRARLRQRLWQRLRVTNAGDETLHRRPDTDEECE
jgi:hypothetical protein